MVSPVPAGVETDLITFFKGRCANPGLVTSRTDNVKHLCGFDSEPLGWRGLSNPINQLTNIVANHLRVDPTDMDSCSTIADIEGKLK